MSSTYRTRQDDVLDWVCWKHYGTTAGAVEAVLDANPGLAEHGPILPGNLVITLPELVTPATVTTIKLWD
ncbi:MAG: hypothetical protein ETSY1_46775 (plasmid) [Candidatus Entotheonella factor]|uniref:Tail protein X n=1 Tax=Entotheonella factor TaxID=1429438 RepID=W4LZQ5_ENTF1|nr:MAG: hypothetical protein ETSY1_46775 [Candidatus Entotheonella factor]